MVLSQDDSLDMSWLSKFACGHLHNPTIRRVEALDRALAAAEEDERAA